MKNVPLQLRQFLIDFDNVSTIRNRNKYSTKQVQIVSFQPDYASTLPGKTKSSTERADRLLQYVLSNKSFQNVAESRSMFLYFSVC